MLVQEAATIIILKQMKLPSYESITLGRLLFCTKHCPLRLLIFHGYVYGMMRAKLDFVIILNFNRNTFLKLIIILR